MDKGPVKLRDFLWMFEHDLWHIGAGLQIAPPLELEKIPFGANHRSFFESFKQTGPLSFTFLRQFLLLLRDDVCTYTMGKIRKTE